MSIPPSLFSSLPSFYSFCLSGMWFLHLTSFFLWSLSCLSFWCLWCSTMKIPFVTSKGPSQTLLPLGNENCIIHSVSLFSVAARKLRAMFYAQQPYSTEVSRYNLFTPLHFLAPSTYNLEFLFLYVCSIYFRLPVSKEKIKLKKKLQVSFNLFKVLSPSHTTFPEKGEKEIPL